MQRLPQVQRHPPYLTLSEDYMCFTISYDGQRYFQIFGILSPPRRIASDADHEALRRLCRTFFFTFAIGSLLLGPIMAFVPSFWAILAAWYYDNARLLSSKTNLPRSPFLFTETLRHRASRQSLSSITAGLSILLLACCIGLRLVLFASHNVDLVLVGALLGTLSATLSWAHSLKLSAKMRSIESPPS